MFGQFNLIKLINVDLVLGNREITQVPTAHIWEPFFSSLSNKNFYSKAQNSGIIPKTSHHSKNLIYLAEVSPLSCRKTPLGGSKAKLPVQENAGVHIAWIREQ